MATSRYSSLVPRRYWQPFPPTIYAVWTGPRHFYVNSHYEAAQGEAYAVLPPVELPTWDEWLRQFGVPAGTAYNPASKLRFTLYINKRETYAFAMQAEIAPFQLGTDTVVHTIADLENWEVAKGLDPEDRQSAGKGGPIDVIVNIVIGFLIRRFPIALPGFAFTPEKYREWRMWGGFYPNQP